MYVSVRARERERERESAAVRVCVFFPPHRREDLCPHLVKESCVWSTMRCVVREEGLLLEYS